MHWTGISIVPCSVMCALNAVTSGKISGKNRIFLNEQSTGNHIIITTYMGSENIYRMVPPLNELICVQLARLAMGRSHHRLNICVFRLYCEWSSCDFRARVCKLQLFKKKSRNLIKGRKRPIFNLGRVLVNVITITKWLLCPMIYHIRWLLEQLLRKDRIPRRDDFWHPCFKL